MCSGCNSLGRWFNSWVLSSTRNKWQECILHLCGELVLLFVAMKLTVTTHILQYSTVLHRYAPSGNKPQSIFIHFLCFRLFDPILALAFSSFSSPGWKAKDALRSQSVCSTCRGEAYRLFVLARGFSPRCVLLPAPGKGIIIQPQDTCGSCKGGGTVKDRKGLGPKWPPKF